MPTVKLVVVGSSGVGKTSLRGQYISGRFSNGYRATIGADFITKTLPHPTNPGETVVLQIWDTAGQERFSSLSSAFFRGADAALLMFDVNAPETMISLKKWWAEFKERAPLDERDAEDYCCVVVGNKIDLKDENPCVSEPQALAFLDELVPSSQQTEPSQGTTPAETSSVPPPSSPKPIRSEAIPVASGSSSSYAPKHTLTKSRTRSPSRFYGTATSTRTTLTIYHTPSSSLFDTFHSARTSPESTPRSLAGSSVLSRGRRQTKLSTGSSSSGVTITPRTFAREQPSSPISDIIITLPDDELNSTTLPSSSSLPSPIPDRGPKLFFTSAKTGEGVSDVFEYIAQRVVKKWAYDERMDERMLHYREGSGDDTVRLGLRNAGRKSSRCC
ncbi:hypothetical protein D9611_013617 [Ephemerocybe angulata]|uniref:Ras-domain-containing protein n=1 Tax=Ephemerocybe angulata TaxID=980116 RepID=A0A8H5AT40_9AGAR|nr:hypothetical protein D9611_013617 [Tulosesus angulatus]